MRLSMWDKKFHTWGWILWSGTQQASSLTKYSPLGRDFLIPHGYSWWILLNMPHLLKHGYLTGRIAQFSPEYWGPILTRIPTGEITCNSTLWNGGLNLCDARASNFEVIFVCLACLSSLFDWLLIDVSLEISW